MNNRRNRLIRLMSKHRKTCDDVGELLGRHSGTVRVWRCKSGPDIPEHTLKLLEALLNEK